MTVDDLRKIYEDNSEWLKFLEAKHAGILAMWVAFLAALMSNDIFVSLNIRLQILAVIIIMCGGMINIISFIPFLNNTKLIKNLCYKKYCNIENDNCLFYRDIFVYCCCDNYSQEFMCSQYKKMIHNEEKEFSKIENDYISPIISISIIATIKAYLFDFSAKYTLTVAILCIALLIIA